MNGGRFDGGRLSGEQKQLRAWYAKLIHATRARAFTAGRFYGLNHANKDNPAFGRIANEIASGHWIYAFLRRESKSGQAYLVVANFHGAETLRGVRIRIPPDAQLFLGRTGDAIWTFADRLDSAWTGTIDCGMLENEGLALPDLAPCTAMLLEVGSQTPDGKHGNE